MIFRLFALLCLALLSYAASAQRYLEMMEAETYSVAEIQQAAAAHFDVVGRGRGSGYKQFKRWEYVALREMDEQGYKIRNNELSNEARSYRNAARMQKGVNNNFSGFWKELGPTYWNATSGWNPGVGHITSIGIDTNNTNHLIVGSPTGGVWKTLDGGNSWVPLTDEFSTVDVYALEISPYNNNLYFWGSTSGKVFRSADAGITWQASGTLGGGNVNRIVFHPNDPNVMYASSSSNGLYRSTNGGSTWVAVPGASGFRGYDIEFKPGDPNTIYFSGLSFYRSTDGGASFNLIAGLGTESNNYKMIGISPANPSVVYVLEALGGRFGAFYKSTNSGATFNKLIDGADINYFGYSSTGDDDRGQAPRNMEVAVNPFDADDVHIAGIHTWKSLDGGASFFLTSYWTPGNAAALGVGYNHADIDILKFAGNRLYVGSDGGMYTSDDGGISFVDRTEGLGIRELYKIGVSKTDPNVVSGGSQDNGTSVMRGDDRAWVDWLGADGMETFIDWSNPNVLYGTSQYGSMYRSDDQGNSASDIAKPIDDEDGAWVTPFEQDPINPNTIYVGFENVWKSTDGGDNWTQISNFTGSDMNEMKIAPSDNKRIYVSRGSTLFTTGTGDVPWTTTANPWSSSTINYIAIHPQNPLRLLVVTASAVYHSTDAGTSWTSIGTGLPSGTKYCAVWENTGKNGIYVGNFGSVSYTNDDLAGQWIGFMDGLPNVRVYELEINYVSSTIFAGTYGRGVWESPIYQVAAPVAAFSANQRTGCRELTVTFSDNSLFTPSAWEWTFEGGTPSTSTLKNPTVTFTGPGTYTVQLKVSNQAGENIAEAIDYITITGPSTPSPADVSRCNPGEITFQALAQPGEHINWYANSTDNTPLFTGETFNTNLIQSSTFYAAASTVQIQTKYIGPSSNTIGGGGNHSGNFYQVIDTQKPVRLKSVKVYAMGAANRTFQLRDATGTVMQSKTVFVPAGESRVSLDIDIPTGTDMQIGCPSTANLYRNNAGVSYPYIVDGVMQIKSSTAGLDYYYYLYDMELEITDGCESDRVAVQGIVNTTPAAAVISAAGQTAICAGQTAVISADPVCPDCLITWSTGETGASISVSATGSYTAIVSPPLNSACGDSPVSNAVSVEVGETPAAPAIVAAGPTMFCQGESVLLQADTVCPGCIVTWSNGATGPSISVDAAGDYSATLSNYCGASLASNSISVAILTTPAAPVLAATGPVTFCAGDSVQLSAANNCPDCSVQWSTGQTGMSITVYDSGIYTAFVKDPSNSTCGTSPVSNAIEVNVGAAPGATTIAAVGTTSLCPGETVSLSVDNDCPGCTITWSNGETGSNILVGTAGDYSAILSNTCGISPASNTIAVSTFTPPVAPVLSAAGPTLFCSGDSVLLIAESSCPGCTVQWSNGQSGMSITVYNAGTYSAFVNDASNPVCGNSIASNSIVVSVGSAPAATTISAAGSTALCPGETVLLTAVVACTDCSVLWSNGETGQNISVSEEGSYSASLVNACGAGPASAPVNVSYYPSFIPVVELANTCHLSAPAGSNYQWLLNGNAIAGANAQNYTVVTAGQYTVFMVNAEGCSGLSAPVAAEACMSGAQDIEGLLSMRLYPNPAQDRVFLDIQMERTAQLQLDLFATDGRFVGQVFQGEVSGGKQLLELKLPDLPAGLYRYRLATAQGSINGELVVQHR